MGKHGQESAVWYTPPLFLVHPPSVGVPFFVTPIVTPARSRRGRNIARVRMPPLD